VRTLTLFNEYRSSRYGEYQIVTATNRALESRGVETTLVLRSSEGLDRKLSSKMRAFLSGLYSRAAYREMSSLLRTHRPDIVHVHNLYPLFSPSVLVACRRANIATVMSVHNYGLTCPAWNHFHDGQICERCLGGREIWCVVQNCRGNMPESFGYGLRSFLARKLNLFHRNVDVLLAGTHFAKQRLVAAGFEEDRVEVLPNTAESQSIVDPASGSYVAYAGRMTEDKGVDTLLEAARRLPGSEFRLAGDGPLIERLSANRPVNAMFLGFLERDPMLAFYRRATCLVVPSRWFEMSPLVIPEAMAHGVPVIASRIGGLPELVEDGVTGLLFAPGDADELADRIAILVRDPALCRKLGEAAWNKVARSRSSRHYFDRLMAAYEKAIRMRSDDLDH
jgi:glycosyltransferase involved in cell wall biosynthesis